MLITGSCQPLFSIGLCKVCSWNNWIWLQTGSQQAQRHCQEWQNYSERLVHDIWRVILNDKTVNAMKITHLLFSITEAAAATLGVASAGGSLGCWKSMVTPEDPLRADANKTNPKTCPHRCPHRWMACQESTFPVWVQAILSLPPAKRCKSRNILNTLKEHGRHTKTKYGVSGGIEPLSPSKHTL